MSTLPRAAGHTDTRLAADRSELGRAVRDVLVVDAAAIDRSAIEAALAPLGCRIVSVRSGAEALAWLRDRDLALVLWSTSPDLAGLETVRLPCYEARAPLMVVTDAALSELDTARGLDLGVYDFVTAPIRPQALRAKASVALQLADRTAELRAARAELRRERAELIDVTAYCDARERLVLLDSITQALVRDFRGLGPAVETLARRVVPALADWCAVYVVRDDRSIDPVAIACSDVDEASAARERLRRRPIDPELSWGVPRAIRSGAAEVIERVTDEMLAAVVHDPEQFQRLRGLGVTAHLAVPLKVQGAVLGCLGLMQIGSRRRFSADDVLLAEEIAARAALLLEHQRLYQEASAARAEAEAANRAKDEFLAMLGHELRNPLAPIVTALQVLEQRDADGGNERRIIDRQVKCLMRLVDDMLDVSRIAAGKIELTKQRVELSEIVARAVELTSPMFRARAHPPDVVVREHGLTVDGDPARLAQVVANVLANAAKYSDPGTPISVTGTRDEAYVTLRVRDRGIGISADMLPNVFELFTQERQALDRSQGGLGLGLAIVRNFVSLHGGTVEVHSAGVGRGSELVISLPAAAEQAVPPELGQARREATASRPHRRIVIVDDNRDASELLAGALTEMGHEVGLAHDGPSGLARVVELSPDVVFLDIGLPGMDGYALARRLRQHPGLEAVRLVALTGYGDSAAQQRSAAAGFDDHLIKPATLERIAALIERPS